MDVRVRAGAAWERSRRKPEIGEDWALSLSLGGPEACLGIDGKSGAEAELEAAVAILGT